MIILEGPDGSGKTELAIKLSVDLNLPIAEKVVSSEARGLVDLVDWVEVNLKGGFQRRIFDRHRLISEMIYGPLLRGEPSQGFDDYPWLMTAQNMFQSLDPIVILCIPPLEIVRENIEKDFDNNMLFVGKEIDRLYWMYFNWAAAHPGYLRYDYTIHPYDHILRYINLRLENHG